MPCVAFADTAGVPRGGAAAGRGGTLVIASPISSLRLPNLITQAHLSLGADTQEIKMTIKTRLTALALAAAFATTTLLAGGSASAGQGFRVAHFSISNSGNGVGNSKAVARARCHFCYAIGGRHF